ncbi:PfkB family carbohydrate kinase [Christensenellaceae bacterium OttesenSCG-928-L17]|nr:PfkB family carbohydrate kinase [Christensenellaceae bacterium OttesenSCG-928-L17]
MGKKFSTFILGQPSLDINTDYDQTTIRAVGGAVVYSGYAASAMGHQTAVLPKAGEDIDVAAVFADAKNVTVFPLLSTNSTSIANVYHTADRERRTCTAISRIDPYLVSEIPDVDAEIYHVAGLMRGDLDESIITHASKKAMAAVDVQCLLRCDENGAMVFHDWDRKHEILPLIHFLKTDAAEAEILTGLTDRVAAAKLLHEWGAKEIMITHNTEVLVYDGKEIYTQPLIPRNLSGRTGRGDTCFSGYITERLSSGIPEALRMAAALVSLKMEIPGPFMGTREDVIAYVKQFYK